MYKNLTLTDIVMLIAALASLVYSEILFFGGERETAIFVGLWVPSILGFALYVRFILSTKRND